MYRTSMLASGIPAVGIEVGDTTTDVIEFAQVIGATRQDEGEIEYAVRPHAQLPRFVNLAQLNDLITD